MQLKPKRKDKKTRVRLRNSGVFEIM